jgi:hypothetical protein
MKVNKFAAALIVGSAMFVSRVSLAADKVAKPSEAKPTAEKSVESKPADAKPADAKPAEGSTASGSTGKLTKPWSDLSSLTDEQKSKIEGIHKKTLAETSVLDKKEKEDIMAVLTDEQKTELKEIAGKKKKAAAAAVAAAKASAATEKKTTTDKADPK